MVGFRIARERESPEWSNRLDPSRTIEVISLRKDDLSESFARLAQALSQEKYSLLFITIKVILAQNPKLSHGLSIH